MKEISIRSVFLCLFICFYQNGGAVESWDTANQKEQDNYCTITGYVKDTDGNPLPFATVYVASTTIGTTTNEKGAYELTNVPFGQRELVVSFVGYQSETMTIVVDKNSFTQNFILEESKLLIEEVQISDRRSRNKWKKNYRRFVKHFLGESPNAIECKILNPEVLRFSSNRNKLSAIAYENLIVENKALGYRIFFLLERFEVYRNGNSIYVGKPRFELMEAKSKLEGQKWIINRYLTYCGSFRHFLVLLTEDNFRKNGFKAYKVIGIQSNTKPIRTIFSAEELIKPGTRNYERILEFGSYLEISFKNEPFYNFQDKRFEYLSGPIQYSWIKMLKPDIIFHTSGFLYEPAGIIFYGQWATEKVADELPLDYKPVSEIELLLDTDH